MLIQEITNSRVQAIIQSWTECLNMQRTSAKSFGIIQTDDVDSVEIKQAIQHFAGQGLQSSIKQNSWANRVLNCASKYSITFTATA